VVEKHHEAKIANETETMSGIKQQHFFQLWVVTCVNRTEIFSAIAANFVNELQT
jgi:hypothetical protein